MNATIRSKPVQRVLGATLGLLLLGGCASAPERTAAPSDPLEPINRRIHAFNEVFDERVAEPVARGYEATVPEPINQGVSNFFSNLDDVIVLVNSALQLKPRATLITANRLLVNTTFGIAGIFDVASRLGARKQNEDFGQTLGYWGAGAGPYLVLPFLGPSSLRDTTGRVVDVQYAPLSAVDDPRALAGAVTLYAVDTRAGLLGTTDVLDTAAVDPYIYMRDAYLRRRINLIYDGNPPAPPADEGADDGFDPFSDEDDDLFEEQGAGGAGAD